MVVAQQLVAARNAPVLRILYLANDGEGVNDPKLVFLRSHGHAVFRPNLPRPFADRLMAAEEAVRQFGPQVIVGVGTGGAVAMDVTIGDAPLVLLAPAWKTLGTAIRVKNETVILHSRADVVVDFNDSVELARDSGLANDSLVEVGTDHAMTDGFALSALLDACLRLAN